MEMRVRPLFREARQLFPLLISAAWLLSVFFSSCDKANPQVYKRINKDSLERVGRIELLVKELSPKRCHSVLLPVEDEQGYWGVIDGTGSTRIPFEFQEIGFFYWGYAVAKKDYRYGIIDSLGHFVVEPIFEDLAMLGPQMMGAKLEGKYALIDFEGRFLSKFEFENVEPTMTGSLAMVQSNEKKGVFHKQNGLVIDTLYHYLESFTKGYFIADSPQLEGVSRAHSYVMFIDTNGNKHGLGEIERLEYLDTNAFFAQSVCTQCSRYNFQTGKEPRKVMPHDVNEHVLDEHLTVLDSKSVLCPNADPRLSSEIEFWGERYGKRLQIEVPFIQLYRCSEIENENVLKKSEVDDFFSKNKDVLYAMAWDGNDLQLCFKNGCNYLLLNTSERKKGIDFYYNFRLKKGCWTKPIGLNTGQLFMNKETYLLDGYGHESILAFFYKNKAIFFNKRNGQKIKEVNTRMRHDWAFDFSNPFLLSMYEYLEDKGKTLSTFDQEILERKKTDSSSCSIEFNASAASSDLEGFGASYDVVIHNISSDTIALYSKGLCLKGFLSYEAQDKDGKWHSVLEYMGSCECGYIPCLLPNNKITFQFPKFQGPFETKARIRYQFEEGKPLYSNTINVSINPRLLTFSASAFVKSTFVIENCFAITE